MANNNISNLRQQIDNMLNYASRPHHHSTSSQTACRFCNRVFMTNKALIAHLETHMAQEEFSIRTLHSPPHPMNSQRQLIPNQLSSHVSKPSLTNNRVFQAPLLPPPQQTMLMPQPRRNHNFNFGYGSNNRVASASSSSQPARQFQLGPKILPSIGNNVAETTPLSTPQIHQQKGMEVSPIDGTRAYINLLEKPYKSVEIIDLVNMDDLPSLNLGLKL